MDRRGAKELEVMIDAEFARSDSVVRAAGTTAAGAAAAGATPARRKILVDGFNVLHAVLLGKERDDGWWRREVREKLLRRVAGWQEGPDDLWVAFDGNSPAWSVWAEPIAGPAAEGSSTDRALSSRAWSSASSTVHSVYVESADDWIVRRARRATNPEDTIVVSGDRKVAGRARSAGCEVWTPWAFVARCPEVGVDLASGGDVVVEPVPTKRG